MEHLLTADPSERSHEPARSGNRRRVVAVAAAVSVVGLVGGGLLARDGGGADRPSTSARTEATVSTPPVHRRAAPPDMTTPPAAAPASPDGASAVSPAPAPASPAVAPAVTHPSTGPDVTASAFDAWRQGNEQLLRDLTTGPVADFLTAREPHETGEWTSLPCDGAAGSSYCPWARPDAQLVLRVANEAASLGQPHAVIGAFFTPPVDGIAVWPFTTAQQGAEAQSGVDQGHQPWLLDPAMVAESYALAELGWQNAGVEVDEVQPSSYVVTNPATGARASLTLAQPVRHGGGGIWAIVQAGPA
jgi:hypothetical protein